MMNTSEEKRIKTFALLHNSFSNGIKNFKADKAREFLKEKGLSIVASGAVFNSGQVHHRKPQAFKDELEAVGFLTRANVGSNNGQIPYSSFGSYSILFPLKNENGETVNFCALGHDGKEKYLNDEGIYPGFPHEMTTRLFITKNVLDAATLAESKAMKNRDAVICIPDGKILAQHEEAIKGLKELEEIVWID